MVVKTHSKSRGVTGLYVGEQNVQRYFPQGTLFVEIQLDHLQIQCKLAPEFWQDHPEIHDPRLCAWLETKYPSGCTKGDSISLTLVPAGKSAFKLKPACVAAPARLKFAPRTAA